MNKQNKTKTIFFFDTKVNSNDTHSKYF